MITAEEFTEKKFDLPEGGRWAELVAGEMIQLQPPSVEHGAVVLNLSKALADWLSENPEGYACYELGLIVARNPDTVHCPPVSYFVGGERFAESDKTITETRPTLVVEIASTPDRIRGMTVRIDNYFGCGVEVVCVINPKKQQVQFVHPNEADVVFGHDDRVKFGEMLHPCRPILRGFEVTVSKLFAEPDWWNPSARPHK